MRQLIKSEKVPIYLWASSIQPGNLMQQIKNIANHPFAFHHVAVMPDCHEGYGMPIGGIMATKDVIIPNAVGVDIGCGMCAVRTSLTSIPQAALKRIVSRIRARIPVGFNHHKVP